MKNIYLDYNSTTPILPEILAEMQEYFAFSKPLNASSSHFYGQNARNLLEKSRNSILQNVMGSAWGEYNLIFTSSGSESNNTVINSFKNSKILYSNLEHSSISKPAENTENATKIYSNSSGIIFPENLVKMIKNIQPELVSIAYANNETGVIQNLAEIAKICSNYGVKLHTDACQALGKISCNFHEIKPDLITISSHKIYGPIGASAVIYKKNCKILPIILGGSQEFGARAGTENLYAIYGFSLACEMCEKFVEKYTEIQPLRDKIDARATELGHLVLCKSAARIPNTTMIAKANCNSSAEIMRLDLLGFSASSGSACSSGLHEESKIIANLQLSGEYSATTRFSLGIHTREDEINALLQVF